MLAPSHSRTNLTLLGAVALVLAIANPAAAPPGDLDPTFDGDGKVTTHFAGHDQARAVALQGDGKIVAAGRAALTDDFGLARYNTDGSLDITFDGDGKVTTDFAGIDEANGVALQGDGKIVAAGSTVVSGTEDFALARYNTDGSLDTTFDGDGRVTTDFAGDLDEVNAVAIQGDGAIVVAGSIRVSSLFDFALARYNTDGSLDTTFDGDGKVTTDFGFDSTDLAFAVATQGDGKIVAAGRTNFTGTLDFALARYNTDGSLDPSFDGDGRVNTAFAGALAEVFGVAIQGDGKIVVAGYIRVSGLFDFALARYNTNGSLDTTFDADGKVTTDFVGGADKAFGVAIQANGRIVAAGYAVVSGTEDFAVARYHTDGSLDTTFSGDGKVTTDLAGSTDQANAVVIQANGRIVAAGFARVSGTDDFALARYTCLRRTSRPMSIPLCP